GVLLRSLTQTYYTNGEIKTSDDYYYTGGVKTSRIYQTYDSSGILLKRIDYTYHPDGIKVQTSDDYRYSGGILTNRYYREYDSGGILLRLTNYTYHPDGRIKGFDDYLYTGGLKTTRYYQYYNSTGVRTRFLLQTYHPDGIKVQTSDDYYYNSLSKLTKRILNQYNSGGVLTSSVTTLFPQTILTSDMNYLLTYFVDGIQYQETLSLTEGLNSIQKTVTGYNGQQVTLEWQITLDTIPPVVSIFPVPPTLTTNPSYGYSYTIDGGIITVTPTVILNEGENLFTRTFSDAAGNTTTVNWTVTLDTVLPTGSITINSGATYANSTNVILALTGSDVTSGVDQMRFSTDGGTTWTAWETFSTTKSLTLPTGDGTKTVQYQLIDKAGLISTVFSDTIILITSGIFPDSSLTSANLTNFSGSPWTLLMSGSSTNTQIIQQSSTQFRVNYDVTQAGSKSGAYVSFDNPTTTTVEVNDLSALTDLIVGISGPSGSQVKFEVEDSLGIKSDVTLLNLSAVMQYYRISKTLFTGIDWTKVKHFIYSIDSTLTSQLTGTLTIQTKTLLYSATALTSLPNSPYLALVPGSTVPTTLVETTSTLFKLNYDVSQAGSFSGGSVVLDNPSTTTVEVGNLSSQTQFTFGFSGSTNGKIKLEFEDSLGAKSSTIISGFTTSTQYFTVSSNLFTGLDWTKIKRINFIVDSTLGNPPTGTIAIDAKTLTFSNVLAITLPGTPTPLVLEGSSAATYLTEPSASQITLNYDVSPTTTSFSGGVFSFDDLATQAIETSDLSQGTTLTLGVRAGSPWIMKLKLEIEDLAGIKSSTLLTNFTTLTQYYTIQKSLFSGIDWTKVKRINFTIDRSMILSSSGYKSWVQVTLNGFLFTPTVVYNSSLTSANLTTLPSGPSLFLLPASSSTTNLTPLIDKFDLHYDATAQGSFSGARISYDKPSTSAIETGNLTALSSLVFGLQAPSNTVRLELVDLNGAKSSVFLTNVQAAEKFYAVSLSSFTGIDKTKIKWIQFTIDPVLTNHTLKTGDLFVSVKGLTTPVLSAPVVSPVTSPTLETTQVLNGTKGLGTGIVINGAVVLPPTDSTSWQYEVSLPADGEHIFNIQETNGAGVLGPVTEIKIIRGIVLPPKVFLTSAPYTDLASYNLRYKVDGVEQSEIVTLVMGENVIDRTISGTPVSFRITRVPTLRQSESFIYDANGNLTSRTDSQGKVVTYAYDVLNRLTSVTGIQSAPVSFKYDKNGNRTEMTDSRGVTTYTYDNLNRLTGVIFPDAKTLSYAYDLAGNLTQLTYPDGSSVSYAYDANSRLTQVTRGTEITTYQYNFAGDLTQETLPNGVKGIYGYDLDGRLTSVRHETSVAALIQSFAYTLDANGNRTKVIETTTAGTKTTNYVYDSLNRLQKVVYPDGKIVTYTYDFGGNRKTMLEQSSATDSGILTTYFYGVENRLDRLTHAQAATPSSITSEEFFYYDSRGNLVSHVYPNKTILYTYDLQNLLTQVEDGTTLTEFIYDGQGNRVAKVVNGVKTNYIVDTNRDISQVLAELDSTGALKQTYTYGLDRISDSRPQTSDISYYLQDGLGSTVGLADSTGSVTETYSYDAFGNLLGTVPNSFLFTGEQLDSETGLIYLRARYYDPTLGRFISKDPVLGNQNQTQSFNPYPYVQNNPVNLRDPSGRFYYFNPDPYRNRLPWSDEASQRTSSSDLYPFTRDLGPLYYDIAQGAISAALYFINPWIGAGYDVYGALRDRSNANVYGAAIDIGVSTALSFLGPFGDIAGSVTGGAFTRAKEQTSFGRRSNFDRYIINGPPGGGGGFGGFGGSGFTGLGGSFFNPSSRGGVLINKAANLVGTNLSQITGATYDPVSGQFILLGTNSASVPDIRMDDLATALRAVYGSIQDSGVTIDPQYDTSGNMLPDQLVRLFGGIENTDLGWVVFEADRVMKTLAAGKDNITGALVTSNVPGYKSMLDRWAASSSTANGSSRFWFVPELMDLTRSSDRKSFTFSQAKVKTLTEDELIGGGAVDLDAQAFAQHLTDNYHANPTDGKLQFEEEFPIFARLTQVMKAVALAKFIKDNSIPIDFSWLEDYNAPLVTTPTTTPTVTNTKEWQEGDIIYTLTVQGGVEINLPNSYLADTGTVSSLAQSTINARSTLLDQDWQVTSGGSTYEAVALSMAPQRLAGNFVISQNDLSVPTPGGLVLGLTRFYDSFEGNKSPFSFGWKIDPFQAKFERPAYVNSIFSSGLSLNGLREGEVRVLDRSTGKELIFRSSLVVTRNTDGSFTISGRNSNGTTSFTVVGDTDGSTFTMNTDKTYLWRKLDGSSVLFDTNGKILKETDRFGKYLSYAYLGGRIASISDSLSRSINLTYDLNGKVTRIDGPLALSATYTYNASGDLISVRDNRTTLVTSYTYDASHNLTGSTDPFGFTDFGNGFDVWGMASSQLDSRNNLFNRTYDRTTRRETIANQTIAKNLIREYDSLQRVIKETDYLNQVTTYTYSGSNRLPASIIDPKGHPVSFTYDTKGHVTKVIDSSNLNSFGATLEFQYDTKGNVSWMRDTKNVVRTFVYDASSNLTEIREILSSTQTKVTKFTYDTAGNLTSITDANNNTRSFVYDTLGNLMEEWDGFGKKTLRTYDTLFRLTGLTDPLNRNIAFTYNNLDQLTAVQTIFGTVNYAYDTKGKLSVFTDANTNQTTFTYDPTTGDLLQVIDPAGNRANYTYDAFGRLASSTDPNGYRTIFQYDDLDQLTYVGADLSSPSSASTTTLEAVSLTQFTSEAQSTSSPAQDLSTSSLQTSQPIPSPDQGADISTYTPLIWDALAREVEAKNERIKEEHPFLIWRKDLLNGKKDNAAKVIDLIQSPKLSFQYIKPFYSLVDWRWFGFFIDSWRLQDNKYCNEIYHICVAEETPPWMVDIPRRLRNPFGHLISFVILKEGSIDEVEAEVFLPPPLPLKKVKYELESPVEYLTIFLKQHKQREAGFKMLQYPKKVLIRGREGARARYESKNNENKLVTAEVYLFVYDKLPYEVRYRVWSDKFERYHSTAMKIIESFRFDSEK
ncbi:MAG: RHS repeat protein, partial [Candidatus Omnitrophica bacterium]|nr:RHS repeat protein [Candidatus Omnitrophota bacterium]